jgi:hypothetical protein
MTRCAEFRRCRIGGFQFKPEGNIAPAAILQRPGKLRDAKSA